jgi:hypothetical protein
VKQISLRVSEQLAARIDRARGLVPRETWIREVLVRATARVMDAQPSGGTPLPRVAKRRVLDEAQGPGAGSQDHSPASHRASATKRLPAELCDSCARLGPPKHRPCPKCGGQA